MKFPNNNMNFIKKIFEDKIDNFVHLQFQKFSKGEFTNRALIRAKCSGSKYTIFTSAEFANGLVRTIAEKLGNEKTKVTGAIISTNDLKNEIEFKQIKQFQGVKKYLIEKEMSGNEIISLMERFPKVFLALSFEIPQQKIKLKIKPKSPKSSKSKNKDEIPKPNFCKLVTEDSEIGRGFIFEKPDFKEANITHTFIIDEIIISDELKQSNDFAKIREESKRKGRIIRKAVIDGHEIINEKEFSA